MPKITPLLVLYLFSLCVTFVYASGAEALEMTGTPEELRQSLSAENPDVSIVGRAKKTTYANLAHITIVVTTKENSISESLEKNAVVREDLKRVLTSSGIASDAIKNSEFSTSPHYGLFRGKKPSKYTVENSVRVTARNEGQLLDVNRAIDEIDGAELGQIEFEVEDEEQLKASLKIEAINDAKQQSASYAQALGLKLTPKSFTFERSAAGGYNNYDRGNMIEEVVVTARRSSGSRAYQADTPTPERVSFEKIEYHSTVLVVYGSGPVLK